MYERGTITTIDKNIIGVICGNPEQCKACPAAKLFCNIKTKEYKALNADDLDLAVGDVVEVYISPAKTIGYSFSVLIFPLIMFIAGYYLTAGVTKTLSEGIKIIGGAVGLASGFLAAYLYNSSTKKQQYPVITKKYDAEEE
jgi:sigma-E factor negative regulatory protein RseC